MDEPDPNNQNILNGDFIDKPEQENYPSENEIILSQNNNIDNTPQNNYYPPPVPLEVCQQPDNAQQNPQPQAPYLKYGAIYNPNYLNPTVPPPILVGNDISNQPVDYISNQPVDDNKNVVLIPVQQQIIGRYDINQDQQALNQIRLKENKKEDCCVCCKDCCSDPDCVNCMFYSVCCLLYIIGGLLGGK